jgi:hypothetical protein
METTKDDPDCYSLLRRPNLFESILLFLFYLFELFMLDIFY